VTTSYQRVRNSRSAQNGPKRFHEAARASGDRRLRVSVAFQPHVSPDA
jgi:hypothetical protein